MTVSKINKSGKNVWRVYLGMVGGKKRYKQFKTQAKANIFVKNERIRKAAHAIIFPSGEGKSDLPICEDTNSLPGKGKGKGKGGNDR